MTATIVSNPPVISGAPTLFPEVSFPEDLMLSDLLGLFDPQWVWQAYRSHFGTPVSLPDRIRIRQFSHSVGRNALVTYEVEWPMEDYRPSECIVARVQQGEKVEVFRYPVDPELPGLAGVGQPNSTLELLNEHVFSIPARRARVELVRFRPTHRAVLRHTAGRARFYVRVVRPRAVPSLLAAYEVVARSSFVIPRIVGSWPDGGVFWLSEIPGRNLRRCIQSGMLPDSHVLLDELQSIWELPMEKVKSRPFNLLGAYERARRSFKHHARNNTPALRQLEAAVSTLGPFVRSWRPTHTAHNDFYDDQLIRLPNDKMALVDFEEAGPGDPLLDVGNFLAHLRWASRFGRSGRAESSGKLYRIFREAALSRFQWSRSDLALREAVCLFRICTNAIRRPQKEWQNRLEAGLAEVNQVLEQAPSA